MTVRFAAPSDEQPLFDLLMFIHEHEPPLNLPPSPAKIRAKIEYGTRGRGGMIGVIDAPDGTIAASAMFGFAQLWWSDAPVLEEAWIYVAPAHRDPEKAHWEALVDWITDIKEKLSPGGGLPAIVGVFARDRAEAKTRLYGSRFEFKGGLFVLP